ncbi:MAG TPA: hypothetical protein VGK33_20290, partial [Chloroflexota bacterium]
DMSRPYALRGLVARAGGVDRSGDGMSASSRIAAAIFMLAQAFVCGTLSVIGVLHQQLGCLFGLFIFTSICLFGAYQYARGRDTKDVANRMKHPPR